MSYIKDATDYQEKAMRFLNPEVRERGIEEMLNNAALGLAGEAGEIADLIKKHHYQGHPLDTMKLKDELGDLCWYVAEACDALMRLEDSTNGLSYYDFQAVLARNLDKLKARYPGGRFERERSVNRVVD